MSKYAKKKDFNHNTIRDYLKKCGVYVEDLSGHGTLPDLLCHFGETFFVEVKLAGSRACYTNAQLKWIADTKCFVAICKSETEALLFAHDPRHNGLTQKQKDNLAGFLAFNDKKKFTPSEVEKVLRIKE